MAYGCVIMFSACELDPRTPSVDWDGTIDSVGATAIVRNPVEPIWEANDEWTAVPEVQIGSVDGDGPDVLGWITALAVSPSGDVAVLDAQASEVRIFDPDGRHVRTVGREGAGPGELRRPLAVQYDSHGSLWVSDAGNARYSVFDSVGRFVASHRRIGGVSSGNPIIMTSEGYLIDVMPSVSDGRIDQIPVRVDTRTGQVDSLPLIQGVPLSGPPIPAKLAPFMSRPIQTFDIDGYAWIAWTDSLLVYRRAPNGDTVRIVHLPLSTPDLTPTEEDSVEAAIREWPFPVDRSELGVGPQTLKAVYADDADHLFVRAHDPDGSRGPGVEVFDSIGRYLGRLSLPVRFADRPHPVFRGGNIYGVVLDSLGISHVVRVRIVRPSAGIR